MRTAAACLAGLIAASCASPLPDLRPALTLDDVLASRSVTGAPPGAPRWDATGRRLAFRWAGPDGRRAQLWTMRVGAPLQQVTERGVGAFAWLPRDGGLVYTAGTEVWCADVASGTRERAGALPAGAGDVQFSPAGDAVA
ncbi:MAG: hypothetical protein ACON4Z_07000, partial [Planctomycetota bacterium]